MSNFNLKNVDFCRQVLLERLSRPLPVIAIYPKNAANTQLLVSVGSSDINIRYISTTTVTHTIIYSNKSVEAVVQEINALTIPVEAATIHNVPRLYGRDIIPPTGSGYKLIPDEFDIYERIDNSGIILRAKRLAVKHKSDSKIKTLSPYSEHPSLPWYPRISNGSFSQKYGGVLHHFYIPEFDDQVWSGKYGKPFKDLYGIQPTQVDENVYQLPRYPLLPDSITLYNGDVPVTSSVIEDVDVNNGLLYIKPGFYLKEGFSLDYSYLETSYVYKDININGHFSQNPLILDKYVVIYILPAESNQGVRKRTVYHVVGDSVDQAIDSIQVNEPNTPIAIIGAYNIQQLFSSDKISILDTRSRGGGLVDVNGPTSPVHHIDSPIESTEVPIEARYQEAYRFWDIGNYDGEAYPGAAAVAVDLPLDLQEVLSISDIKSKASKFMAAGVYPSVKFTERELPSVSGLSAQVSCAYNLDFSDVLTGSGSYSLLQTMKASVSGNGWFYETIQYPNSIIEDDWSNFDIILDVGTDRSPYIQVSSSTGVIMPFLKSTAWAGISWEERTVVFNEGSVEEPISYSPWKTVKYLDTKEVATGELIKSYLTFKPENSVKHYRNVKINAPIQTGNLKQKLEDSISTIIDNTLALQRKEGETYGTSIVSGYTKVGDLSAKALSESYLLLSNLYHNIFNLESTPLEETYYEDLYKIGEDFIQHGTYSSGHFFKAYLQNINQYVNLADGYPAITFTFNNELKALNKYLNLRSRYNSWSGACDSGALSSTGLAYQMMVGSTIYSGPFERGIPIYWTYYPTDYANGFFIDYLSGYQFEDPYDLGATESEIIPTLNYDYLYNFTLPAVMSTCMANYGQDIYDTNLQKVWTGAYELTVQNTVNKIQQAILTERTYSGLPAPTNWFIGNNRLGTYLGNSLFNIIEAQEYVQKYNLSRTLPRSTSYPPGISSDSMVYMLSGIEKILDVSYDAVAHNLLRGGIVEPDMALTIYGYGWYLNNWPTTHGIRSKTYSLDKREKFEKLFTNGLKQLIKNTVTPNGELLETTTVQGEIGPFAASTVSKILYPLAEALKYDYTGWAGIAEGLLNNLVNNYSIDGLYYIDPYKQSDTPGKEKDILPGLINLYKGLAQTGSYSYWEPMSTGLDSLRGTAFLPPGVTNTLDLWKNYSSGDVLAAIGLLKGAGFNTIEIPLDMIYWKYNSGDIHNKFDHLLSGCNSYRMRAIPIFMDWGTTAVNSGQENAYVTSFGHTGSYYYSPITGTDFVGGIFSGEGYVNQFVSRYDSDPAILAWGLNKKPINNAQAVVNYNSLAYHIKQLTNTPVIYNIDSNISYAEYYSIVSGDPSSNPYTRALPVEPSDIYNLVSPLYNPRVDFVGIQPDGMFDLYLDSITSRISKPKIVTNYGDGAFRDYAVAIERAEERNIPYIVSKFFVQSGEYHGNLYSDGTSRSVRQLNAVKTSAYSNGIYSTGASTQVKIFSNKYFYPSGYTPAYTSTNALVDLSSWTTRERFSETTSGEIYKQSLILSNVQSGLDTLNYLSTWTADKYSVPALLTQEECTSLIYYNSTWNAASPFSEASTPWTLSGIIDYNKYNTFLDNWGVFLYSICDRLNIDG